MEPYIGQLCLFGFNFAPQGWAICDGSMLPLAQYSALFSLLGTRYGGDGRTTFALPDLRGRVPVGMGQGLGLSKNIEMGEAFGIEAVTLTQTQLPSHTHSVSATVSLAASGIPLGAEPSGLVPAAIKVTDSSGTDFPASAYGNADGTKLAANAATVEVTCAPSGVGGAFDIRNPGLGMNWCIATQGVYPPRQ